MGLLELERGHQRGHSAQLARQAAVVGRKVDHGEITGAVPVTNGTAVGDEFVAIECLR